MREAPDSLFYQGAYATVLLHCGGSRAEAMKIADALAKVERPYLYGSHLYNRARILAMLGDREGAVRALQEAFAQGYDWNGLEMHLSNDWNLIRDYPPFIELMKPKG
jgi:tetratricopeptide (TPR) repeat protein